MWCVSEIFLDDSDVPFRTTTCWRYMKSRDGQALPQRVVDAVEPTLAETREYRAVSRRVLEGMVPVFDAGPAEQGQPLAPRCHPLAEIGRLGRPFLACRAGPNHDEVVVSSHVCLCRPSPWLIRNAIRHRDHSRQDTLRCAMLSCSTFGSPVCFALTSPQFVLRRITQIGKNEAASRVNRSVVRYWLARGEF